MPFGNDEELSALDVQHAFVLLNRDGYFNDENSHLGSYCVKHRSKKVEAAVRDLGYDGPELALNGHFYPAWGAVYWLYNPDRVSYHEARHLTDSWVQSQQSKRIVDELFPETSHAWSGKH